MSRINQFTNLNTPDDIPKNSSLDEFNLDANTVILVFQEKVHQLMTELIIKDATIRQQLNLINKLKERKLNEKERKSNE